MMLSQSWNLAQKMCVVGFEGLNVDSSIETLEKINRCPAWEHNSDLMGALRI